jgi:hypothetical protein
MKTFVLLTLDSEGAGYLEVSSLLADLGFRPLQGEYDFVYDWDREASVKDSLFFADRVHAALRGKRVWFRVETTPD